MNFSSIPCRKSQFSLTDDLLRWRRNFRRIFVKTGLFKLRRVSTLYGVIFLIFTVIFMSTLPSLISQQQFIDEQTTHISCASLNSWERVRAENTLDITLHVSIRSINATNNRTILSGRIPTCGKFFVQALDMDASCQSLKVHAFCKEQNLLSVGHALYRVILPHNISKIHTVRVCTASKCSNSCSTDGSDCVKPIDRVDPGDISRIKESVLYVFYPGIFRSGGPESLHRIHQMVNMLYLEGSINIRSLFLTSETYYANKCATYET